MIRAATAADAAALHRICLLTGDAGRDASDLYRDATLPRDGYVGPYLHGHPAVALVHDPLPPDPRTGGAVAGTVSRPPPDLTAPIDRWRRARRRRTIGAMGTWGSYSFLAGPILALVALGGLALVARWASRTGTSLIEAPAKPGTAEEYGLMIPVASPPNDREAHVVTGRLTDAGVRSREVHTTEGLRIMVWSDDVARARSVLDSPR